jgi:hypothetical protein
MGEALTRRAFTTLAASAVVAPAWAQQKEGELITKAIPHSAERIPAVGLGTAVNFNTADAETERKASEVVGALVAGGGRLIDTASSYRDAERVIGRGAIAAPRFEAYLGLGRSGRACGHTRFPVLPMRWRGGNGRSQAGGMAVLESKPR